MPMPHHHQSPPILFMISPTMASGGGFYDLCHQVLLRQCFFRRCFPPLSLGLWMNGGRSGTMVHSTDPSSSRARASPPDDFASYLSLAARHTSIGRTRIGDVNWASRLRCRAPLYCTSTYRDSPVAPVVASMSTGRFGGQGTSSSNSNVSFPLCHCPLLEFALSRCDTNALSKPADFESVVLVSLSS